jgi:hypothetical protein
MLFRLRGRYRQVQIIKDTVGGLTDDRRLQAMFIAFSFWPSSKAPPGSGAGRCVGRHARRTRLLAVLRGQHLSSANTAPVRLDRSDSSATLANVTGGFRVMALSADGRPPVRDDLP